jgi:hypothetical protein
MKIFAYGSFELGETETTAAIQEFGRSLGRELANAGHTVIVVSTPPYVVDRYILEGMDQSGASASVIQSRTSDPRYPFDVTLFPNIKFYTFDNPGQLNNAHIRALSIADAVITYHGSHPLDIEIGYQAVIMDKPILPIATFGAAAKRLWEEKVAPAYQARGYLTRESLAALYPDGRNISPRDAVNLIEVIYQTISAAPKKPPKVFICHSKEDKPSARSIYAELTRRNIDPWIDEKELFAGLDWDVAIKEAIQRADAILVLLSAQSLSKRGYVQQEIRRALEVAKSIPEGRVFVIPVRLEDVALPVTLKHLQAVDYYADNFYESVVRGIRCAVDA